MRMKFITYVLAGILLFVIIQIETAKLSPCSVWSSNQEECDSNYFQGDN